MFETKLKTHKMWLFDTYIKFKVTFCISRLCISLGPFWCNFMQSSYSLVQNSKTSKTKSIFLSVSKHRVKNAFQIRLEIKGGRMVSKMGPTKHKTLFFHCFDKHYVHVFENGFSKMINSGTISLLNYEKNKLHQKINFHKIPVPLKKQ